MTVDIKPDGWSIKGELVSRWYVKAVSPGPGPGQLILIVDDTMSHKLHFYVFGALGDKQHIGESNIV